MPDMHSGPTIGSTPILTAPNEMIRTSITRQIEPIANHSLVDQVELKLMDFLMESRLKEGDPLPKEVDLAKAFGVSRTVIREAMTRLRMRGLVESSKRKGSVVTRPDLMKEVERMMHPQILSDETLKDIFELRLVLEVGMADLVFARKTPEDLAELEEIVKDEPSGRSNSLFASEFEVRFHGKLYQITNNQTLQRFQDMLLPVFGYVHESGMLASDLPERPWVSHRGLLDILRSGTSDMFRQAMRVHLDNHFQRIIEHRS